MQVRWELVGTSPVAAHHRRLSSEHLGNFVHTGLLHKRDMPTPEDLRRWQRLKPSASPHEEPDPDWCTEKAIAPLIGCLFKGYSDGYSIRLSCIQALKERAKDCSNVAQLLADLLLSDRDCGGERAAFCGGLVNAHLILARPSYPNPLPHLRSTLHRPHPSAPCLAQPQSVPCHLHLALGPLRGRAYWPPFSSPPTFRTCLTRRSLLS